MSKIDDELKSRLNSKDQKAVDELDREGGLTDLVSLSFSGTGSWITYYMYFVGFAAFFAAVYLYVNFAATADIKTSLAYGIGIVICVLVLVMVKILSWQNMQRLELLRELKRIEMRVMQLSK